MHIPSVDMSYEQLYFAMPCSHSTIKKVITTLERKIKQVHHNGFTLKNSEERKF